MKTINTALVAAASLAAPLIASAQTWVEIPNVIPAANTVVESSYELGGGTNASLINDLKDELNWGYYGMWKSHFSGLTSGSNPALQPEDDPLSVLLAGGKKEGYSMYTQSHAVFEMPAEAMSADAVRVSFNVDYIGRGLSLGFEIWVDDWDEGGELGILGLETPADGFQTRFLFGLMNLEADNFVEASLSSGGTKLFDYTANDWLYTVDENNTLVVSFEIDAAALAAFTTNQFGIVIETTPLKNGVTEYYAMGNFKIEVVNGIQACEIKAVAVSGEDVTLTATSGNTSGFYAIYSAPDLLSLEEQWTYTGVTGSIEADGGIAATFPKEGGQRFYRVLTSAEVFDSGGSADAFKYSINTGGYYTVFAPNRITMLVSNQFDQDDQKISTLFDALPRNSKVVFTRDDSTITASRHPVTGSWSNGAETAARGRILQVTSAGDADIVFSGVLYAGTYSNLLGKAEILRTSMLPLSCVPESMGIPTAKNVVLRKSGTDGNVTTYSTHPVTGAWTGGAPTISCGEAFFLRYPSDSDWNQTLAIPTDGFKLNLTF